MTPDPDAVRVSRRRHKHERQAVIFGVLIAFLAIAALSGLAVYSGAVALPNQADFVKKVPTGPTVLQAPACVPVDTLPTPYPDVHVTVLNGSDRSGLAGTIGGLLTDREFTVDGTGNDPRRPNQALVSFGEAGVGNGYTLLAHYPDAQLVLDARKDDSVDLTVPASFEALLPEDSIELDPTVPLISLDDCEPAEEITPLPAPARFDEQEKAAKKKAAKKKKAKEKKAKEKAESGEG